MIYIVKEWVAVLGVIAGVLFFLGYYRWFSFGFATAITITWYILDNKYPEKQDDDNNYFT